MVSSTAHALPSNHGRRSQPMEEVTYATDSEDYDSDKENAFLASPLVDDATAMMESGEVAKNALKRAETSKVLRTLRTRLTYAKFKLSHGWTTATLTAVEVLWNKKQQSLATNVAESPIPSSVDEKLNPYPLLPETDNDGHSEYSHGVKRRRNNHQTCFRCTCPFSPSLGRADSVETTESRGVLQPLSPTDHRIGLEKYGDKSENFPITLLPRKLNFDSIETVQDSVFLSSGSTTPLSSDSCKKRRHDTNVSPMISPVSTNSTSPTDIIFAKTSPRSHSTGCSPGFYHNENQDLDEVIYSTDSEQHYSRPIYLEDTANGCEPLSSPGMAAAKTMMMLKNIPDYERPRRVDWVTSPWQEGPMEWWAGTDKCRSEDY